MKTVFICILLSIALFSCKKSTTDDSNGGPIDGGVGKVYSVGYLSAGDFFSRPRTAKIWVDDVETSLTDGTKDALAIGIFLQANDVYVAGFESNGTKNVAKLWKNNVATNLSDGSKNAVANAVFVSGTDVYVTGFEAYGILGSVELTRPVLWKNGVATYLPISGADRIGVATSVCVLGNDVYVAGTEKVWVSPFYYHTAKLWKNGIATVISSANQIQKCNASVTLSGNDIYTGYFEELTNGNKSFTLQKNGVITSTITGMALNLSSAGENTYDYQVPFTVSGADVYVAGINSSFNNAVYKNGIASPSLNSTSHLGFNCIAVSGADVYIGGLGAGNTNQGRAAYVKNGANKILNNSTRNSHLLGIAIKK